MHAHIPINTCTYIHKHIKYTYMLTHTFCAGKFEANMHMYQLHIKDVSSILKTLNIIS